MSEAKPIPAGTREDPWTRPRFAIDVNGHHLVSIGIGSNDDPPAPGEHVGEMTHLLLGPKEALDLAQQIINTAVPQFARMLRDANTGECATCNNIRMVTTEKHGRPWTEHCPDCGPPAPTPTADFWAEKERTVLGQ